MYSGNNLYEPLDNHTHQQSPSRSIFTLWEPDLIPVRTPTFHKFLPTLAFIPSFSPSIAGKIAMAAEPPTNSSAPVSYSVLPPYPELILSAIEAVDDKNGANKSSISKQIEATYGSLPAAHSTLLSHHLNKMKASGQLVIIKNNYVKPDPNAPPRRGRGRPPKAKQDLPEGEGGAVASSPRPRGRPPKPRDDFAPKEAAPLVSGRKRGRPPKLGKPATAAPAEGGGERRGRGRPPKVKTPTAAPVGA
ncbi:hypothetical protein L6452_17945 [Arctium lappa]|uniref:Uncharacterized protein n=1 Tax=Arctium lappa TaxID=4217 RepID=A0ACB9C4U7_ARCLA|nr:hypothetical protein L6452_17945 [Arctium lappa]